MNQLLKIEVLLPDHAHAGEFKSLFRQSIEIESSLDFDFKTLLCGLRLLFPNKQTVINLNLM